MEISTCQPSQWCQQFEHVTSLLALFHVQRNTFLSCWSIFLAAASASSTLLMNKYYLLGIELGYGDIIIIPVSGLSSFSTVGDQQTRIIIIRASHAQPSAFSIWFWNFIDLGKFDENGFSPSGKSPVNVGESVYQEGATRSWGKPRVFNLIFCIRGRWAPWIILEGKLLQTYI